MRDILPSLGHLRKAVERKPNKHSPDLLLTLTLFQQQRKDLPAKKRLHLGTQEILWKALDSGAQLIRFSSRRCEVDRVILTSALIDWAETPKTANLRSRAPAESRELWTPGGIFEKCQMPFCRPISELAFAGNSELSQASNALSRKSPSFSRLHIVYGGRVCLSKTRAAYVLRRAPRIGKRHRRRISIQMFFTRDGLRWEDSRTWRHHQTFRKWTSRHIEPGRYGDSRGTLKKLQKRTTKHSSVWTERSGVMQLPRLPSTAKPQELKLCEDRHKLSFHTSLSPARWVQRITIWYPLVN